MEVRFLPGAPLSLKSYKPLANKTPHPWWRGFGLMGLRLPHVATASPARDSIDFPGLPILGEPAVGCDGAAPQKGRGAEFIIFIGESGAGEETRTPDPRITNG
ncbi:protein of unknown function [Magnetospirillum sp. XM-1]|nr:protein of unknown function [Magnetospirillum sp. XM-1]